MNSLRVAIFGCGGRIMYLMNTLLPVILKEHNVDISRFIIVAIYDPNFHQMINFCRTNRINTTSFDEMLRQSKTKIYLENEEDVYKENDFVVSIIGNKNNQHYKSLILANNYKKNIYCEKPIVSNLVDLLDVKAQFADRLKGDSKLFFQTGLCLRYTKICKEAITPLSRIGLLKKVYGCEKLSIGHAAHSFMQCWRGIKSVSGGLGLEKCVHDYDMLMHFIEKGCHINISKIQVSSIGNRKFWIPTRKQEIMNTIESDAQLKRAYHSWDHALLHRLTDNPYQLYAENPNDCIPDKQRQCSVMR